MRFEALVAMALKLPETEEGVKYGKMSTVNRNGKGMFWLRDEADMVAFHVQWEDRYRLLLDRPEVCYLIRHFKTYPAILVRLNLLDGALAQELVDLSYDASQLKLGRREEPGWVQFEPDPPKPKRARTQS